MYEPPSENATVSQPTRDPAEKVPSETKNVHGQATEPKACHRYKNPTQAPSDETIAETVGVASVAERKVEVENKGWEKGGNHSGVEIANPDEPAFQETGTNDVTIETKTEIGWNIEQTIEECGRVELKDFLDPDEAGTIAREEKVAGEFGGNETIASNADEN